MLRIKANKEIKSLLRGRGQQVGGKMKVPKNAPKDSGTYVRKEREVISTKFYQAHAPLKTHHALSFITTPTNRRLFTCERSGLAVDVM
jgi:hypothetical protein